MSFIYITVVTGIVVVALSNMSGLFKLLFPQSSIVTPSCSCESNSEESVNSPYISDSESESKSDYEDESTVDFNYKSNVVTEKTPCYMRDFYEESLMSPRWCTLNDSAKQFRLEKELNEYTKQSPKE